MNIGDKVYVHTRKEYGNIHKIERGEFLIAFASGLAYWFRREEVTEAL